MTYKPYQTVRINEYTQLDVVPYESIESVAFKKCNEPTETLEHYYNRAEKKPQIMTNGGLFHMANGKNILSFIHEYQEENLGKVKVNGMGISTEDNAKLNYGMNTDRKWRCFMSAYPMLVIDGKAVSKYDKGAEINYKATRTAVGVREDGTLLILTVDKPGMTFEQMTAIFLQYYAVYAMNLDGGGSVRKMHEDKVVNQPTTNRPVDNVFCVYLKQDPLSKYKDKDSIADWAKPYVEYVTQQGIMGGSNSNFRPNDPITRQEMAAVITRMMKKNL